MKKEPKQPSPEEIKKLLEAMKQMGAPTGAAPGPAAPRPSTRGNRILSSIMKSAQSVVVYLDRFINFITKSSDEDRNDVMQSARMPILFGGTIVFIYVVFGGLWSATAPLDSAATAIGTVVPSKGRQILTHNSGGVIKHIYVKDGAYLLKGQPIIELDSTSAKSNYDIYLNQYRTALAIEARLIAEHDKLDSIDFPDFLKSQEYKPEIAKILNTQISLFESRRKAFQGEIETGYKKIEQSKKTLEGYRSRLTSAEKALSFSSERLEGTKKLAKQGFASKHALSDVEAKKLEAESHVVQLQSEISKEEETINITELSITNAKNKYLENVNRELKENQIFLNDAKEKFTQAQDMLNKTLIVAPVEGVLLNLNYHTVGAYVHHGQPIAEISPKDDHLIVEAKIPHKQIESVKVGLRAKIRFSAFKSRTTPVFSGTVVSLSPDIVIDQKAARDMQNPTMAGDGNFYVARIEIDMDEFNKVAKARNISLRSGMQAEVQLVIGTRTLLQYLLDPITDNMFKSFKEK